MFLYKIFFAMILSILFIPYTINFCCGSKKTFVNETVINDIEFEPISNILEDYIKCVVAAEMPISFELEALKAQAVAARTYAIRNYDGIDYKNLYQAYISVDDMRKKWGTDFEKNYKKICDAVDATKGQTIKYNGEIIEAVFHSTSAGLTENSENVWQRSYPYLKSVDSHDDENAPNFQVEKRLSLKNVIKLINNRYKTNLTVENFFDKFIIAQRSKAGYIKNINICDKNINAMEIRMLLGLRSTNFTFKKDGADIIFVTKGYGHGSGMSQYGANFMAQRGYNYKQILQHYYSGVEIT